VGDIRSARVDEAVARFDAVSAPPNQIHAADVDIYVPCALGDVITVESVGAIRARAVAGAANNQIATADAGEMLAARGILFAPDYVINAGGIISGADAIRKLPGRSAVSLPPLDERLFAIRTRLSEIFERAQSDRRTPEATAQQMAREIIARAADQVS
jgi:leucine dehydrogenase